MSFAMLSAPLASAATAGTARRMRSPGPAAGAGAIASALTYGGRKRCPRALSSLATSSATSFSRQNAGGMRGLGSGGLTRCAASSNDDDVAEEEIDGGLSSSFAEELRRRRSAGGGESGGESGGKEDKWGPRSENDLSFDDAPRFTKDDGARGVETDQLKRSRELNSEGLEGFPARAGELLKLGLASFISFGPLIAVFSTLFVGTYLFLGSDFIHGGDSYGGGGPPAYISPEVLLAEPTVDRMVPMK